MKNLLGDREGNLRILKEHKTEVNEIQSDLWDFLIQNSPTISSIENWDDYRRATEISGEKMIRAPLEEFMRELTPK